MMRHTMGPVAAFKSATVIDRLPKTQSCKILRATMAKLTVGEAFKMRATIDNPVMFEEIKTALQVLGYARD